MRLYLDEDSCDGRFVSELRRLGADIEAANELGRAGLPDNDQLLYAAGAGRVLVTGNVEDFHLLQREWAEAGREHSGILLWKQSARFSPEQLAALVVAYLRERTAEQLTNALLMLPGRR